MKKVVFKIFAGLGWGFSWLVLVLFVGVLVNPDFVSDISQAEFVKHVVCSAATGIGFVLPSLVYSSRSLSRTLQVIIHLGIGFAVYIPCALIAGWLPTSHGTLAFAISIICFFVVSFAIYFGFYLYYKNMAKKINNKIKSK